MNSTIFKLILTQLSFLRMRTKVPKIFVDSLGCSKNTVDSEHFIAQAKANQFIITENPEEANVAVINTCGFIESAKEESIDHILSATDLKKQGKLDKVMVMGCLSDRYSKELKQEIPDVDQYYGNSFYNLHKVLNDLGGDYRNDLLGERSLTNPPHYAYLKISEGCDNPCSFCAIPIMRGGHVSRSFEDLEREAKKLKNQGVKELILIGQDTTYYGLDLYKKRALAELLERMSDIGFDWIRLQYAYPARFPHDIIPVIRERENIVNYLDMPLQHVNSDVLKSMRRGIKREQLYELLHTIKSEIPGIRLRTTFIVGYPNEGEEEFEQLKDFVRDIRFSRMGCFPYSQEDATYAFDLGDPIPDSEKQRRVRDLMELQEGISKELNEELIGSVQRVMIDRIESGIAYGRTEFDTPEVDNEVIIQTAKEGFNMADLKVGEFRQVEIIDAEAFDLFGELVG